MQFTTAPSPRLDVSAVKSVEFINGIEIQAQDFTLKQIISKWVANLKNFSNGIDYEMHDDAHAHWCGVAMQITCFIWPHFPFCFASANSVEIKKISDAVLVCCGSFITFKNYSPAFLSIFDRLYWKNKDEISFDGSFSQLIALDSR